MKKITYICDDKLADEIMENLRILQGAIMDQDSIDLGELGSFDGANYDFKKPGVLDIQGILD